MHRDQNLLFAVFIVQLKKLSPIDLMDHAAAWAADPSRDLPSRLVAAKAISDADRNLIQQLVDKAVEAHGGDPTKALETFGGDQQIHQTFHGTLQRTESGIELGVPPAGFESDVSIHEIPGRYKELSEHGRGGMGRVLLVHDEALGRDIVLKELLPPSDEPGQTTPARKSASMMARFLQEAKITGQLEHPAIAPVYELGYRFDGSLYYTMKLVRGKTLSQALAECQSLQDRLALLPHFADLCQALAYAHARGVIHRDLKPANIMIGEFGETVVLDWGLAKIQGKNDAHTQQIEDTVRLMRLDESTSPDHTAPGEILGTPLYMAPEQARGEQKYIDQKTDIYALGAILYHILTGNPPFEWTNPRDVIQQVAEGKPVPIENHEPAAPPELQAICACAMNPKRENRYPSAKAMAADVTHYLSGAIVGVYTYSPAEQLARFTKKYRPYLVTTAAAIAVVITINILYLIQLNRSNDQLSIANLQLEQKIIELDNARLLEEQMRIAAETAQQRADAEADTANRITDFLVGLFRDTHNHGHDDHSGAMSIEDRIRLATEAFTESVQEQPIIKARLLDTVGRIYGVFTHYDEALPLLKEALAIRKDALGPSNEIVASTMEALAVIHHDMGQESNALELLEQAIEIRRTVGRPNDTDLAHALLTYSDILGHEDQLTLAEAALTEATAILEQHPIDPRSRIFGALHQFGHLKENMDQYPEAVDLFEREIALRQEHAPNDQFELNHSISCLVSVLNAKGDYERAAGWNVHIVDFARETRTLHTLDTNSLFQQINTHFFQGEYKQAEPLYREKLRREKDAHGPFHPTVAATLAELAVVLANLQQHDEAILALQEAVAIAQRSLGPEDQRTRRYQDALNNALAENQQGDSNP